MDMMRLLDNLRHAAQRRAMFNLALQELPMLALLVVAGWKLTGSITLTTIAAIAGLVLLAAMLWHTTRKLDSRWLIRKLDAQCSQFDDSADLLFTDQTKLNALQLLQRERLQQRLSAEKLPDLRPAWSLRRIALAWLIAATGIAALLLWPATNQHRPALAPGTEPAPSAPGIVHLTAQALRIAPPAYTRLPTRDETLLDAKAPQASRLQWWLRFNPQPAAAELVFVDGRRVALQRDGDAWTAGIMLNRSALYRIVAQGAAPNPPLHRLDALPDLPPQIKVIAPEQGLTLMQAGQRQWQLAFDASDDYGVADNAELRIVLAQGSGENIKFAKQQKTLSGNGTITRKRFAAQLDLAALNMGVGDDLVVQLTVHDNRSPSPQSTHSPSLILRWLPPQQALASGIDGVVQRVLPAYFSSQRQVIIDAENLLKEQPKISREKFAERSDRIGVDQRLLRLRYGQFLGMEDEGAPETEHRHDDDSDNNTTFGTADNVLAEYGHTHDMAEAATLLDPKTRAILKQALEQMWQSELHLRQGAPKQALPYAYKALEYIKQVQQADRIYLARVGTQLPPIDFARRMGGKREGIANRPLPTSARSDADEIPARIWRELDSQPGRTFADMDFSALQSWLSANENRLDDPLALLSAIETLRADPGCEPCRDELRKQLWRALQRPPVEVPRRDTDDAQGQRYLDALRQEATR